MYTQPSGGWRDAWTVPSTSGTATGKTTTFTTTTATTTATPRATRARAASSTPASTGTGTPPRPGLGYLAFPGGRPPVLVATGDNATSTSSSGASSTSIGGPTGTAGAGPAQPKPKPTATTTHSKPDSQRQSSSRSRVLEQAEAERGEHEWVACGGMLRDQHGNVDVERTKKVREEVERKEKERMMKARWDTYEEAWKMLSVGGKGKKKATEKVVKDVGFGDVPWPVWVEDEEGKEKKPTMTISLRSRESCPLRKKKRVTTLEDLTVDRVQDFLYSPLSIRGCTVMPKTRIRSSFLRWHPDKLGWLIDRVKDDDVENVKMGIGIVVESLQRMNGALKGS